jgi:single-strand DNA-binding protein
MIRGHVIGRLGRDPELKVTGTGVNVCHFSVASDDKVKGEKVTTWVDVTLFGKVAELCNQYLYKGSLAFIEGKIEMRSYQGKDGDTRYSLSMIGDQIQFLSPKEDRPVSEPVTEQPDSGMIDESDIPY